MSSEERLQQLLSQWQHLRQQGTSVSPEQLCKDQPELAAPLADRIRTLLASEQAPADPLVTGDHVPQDAEVPFSNPAATGEQIAEQKKAPPGSLVTQDYSPESDEPPTRDALATGDYVPDSSSASAVGQSSTGDFAASHSQDTLLDLPPVLAGGRYEFLEELGRGSFGMVVHARDNRTGQTVALKVMRRQDSTSLELFKGEFRYLQGVSHPNLVQLYELVSDGEDWLLTMEYVEGVDFMSHVRPGGALDLRRLRDTLGQLAEGITALHGHRRIHRDLKPQNVRVSPEGRVVVLDFGLAAELNPQGEHQADLLAGTIAYMAPEQAAQPPVVSPASDWYAMGVMLYQALTGRLPFTGKDFFAVLQQKRQGQPLVPRELCPEVPEDLNTLCLRLLCASPAERPTATEILASLGRTSDEMVGAPTVGEVPLLGRERHLQLLEEAYQESQQGQAVMVAVQGPSGIGKSALVRHFLDRLRSESVVVLAGRCYEHESVPYKVFDPIVDELTRYLRSLSSDEIEALLPADVAALARVFPVLKRIDAIARRAERSLISPDPQVVRRQAFTELRELLTHLGQRQPLVLYVDDLQWGDIDSAYLLADLIQPPNPPRLLLLTANRSEDVDSPCLRAVAAALQRVGAIHRRELTVEPLSENETRELVVQTLGNDAAGQSPSIAKESGGNPFFIMELIQEIQSGSGRSIEGSVTLDGLIRSRVERLPEAARRLLEVVVVSGRPLEDILAYQTVDSDEGRLMMARLEAGRFIRGVGMGGLTELETYHDRIREAVIAGLSAELLRDHHGRIAQVLEESGCGDLEELAIHFEGAKELDKAGDYYEQAADRAVQALAFDHAANLYQKSLDLQHLEVAAARDLHTKLGDALTNAGRGAEAGHVYVAAAEGAEGLEKLDLQRKAMDQLLLSGRTEEGLKVLNTLFRKFGQRLPNGPRREFLGMVWETIRLRMRGTSFRERPADSIPAEELWKIDVVHSAGHRLSVLSAPLSACLTNRAARWALDSGELWRIVQALSITAAVNGLEGKAAQTRTENMQRIAFELNDRINDPFLKAYITHNSAIRNWCYGRWTETLKLFKETEEIASEGQVSFATYRTAVQHWSLDCQLMTGCWREYAANVRQYLEDARRRGDKFATCAMLVHSYLPALMSDRPHVVDDLVEQGWASWPQKGNVMWSYWGLYSRIEALLYQQNGKTAEELIRRELTGLCNNTYFQYVQLLFLIMTHLQGRTSLAAAESTSLPRWYFSERSRLLRSAARKARKIDRAKMPWSNPLAKLLRAGIANLRGQPEEAISLLAKAEEESQAADQEMYAAAARRQRGRLLGGDEGQALVQSADDFMNSQDVCKPERIAAILVPGFTD